MRSGTKLEFPAKMSFKIKTAWCDKFQFDLTVDVLLHIGQFI